MKVIYKKRKILQEILDLNNAGISLIETDDESPDGIELKNSKNEFNTFFCKSKENFKIYYQLLIYNIFL